MSDAARRLALPRSRFSLLLSQTQARVKPYICTMPLRLSEGWNQVQLNIADLMRKAYGTTFVEISRGASTVSSSAATHNAAHLKECTRALMCF
jgi:hypothetical protein